MLEIQESPTRTGNHLRPLDARRDLLEVANLIETCFSSTMDPDGREYLRQMRQAARDETILRWTSLPGEMGTMLMTGYVWDEDHAIVGNLSLIPLVKQFQRIFLIANVAVRPDYRRRGIARALTQAALDHARRQGASSAWLQVREDNQPAFDLYRSLGFIERARRSTWIANHAVIVPGVPAPAVVTERRSADWPFQRTWLTQLYPLEVTWNLNFNLGHLRPSLINDILHFLFADQTVHLAARAQDRLLGIVTREPSRTYADTLWLAAPPETEDLAIRALMPAVRQRSPSKRPLSLNYPAGRGVDAFQSTGLTIQHTLVWMEHPNLSQPGKPS